MIEVYLLGGQSNMSGVGLIENLPLGYLPQPEVMLYHSDATGGVPFQWMPNTPSGFSSFGVETFGPEISLGRRISELRPTVDIALIKHSRGGSNLAVDWNPGLAGVPSSQGIKYREFFSTVNSGLATLQAENPGSQIQLKAMFWHQGESDASNSDYANSYQQNFANFIGRVREDLASPDLPFIYGTINQRTQSNVLRVISAQFRVDESSSSASATTGAHVIDFRHLPTHADLLDGFRDSDDTHFNGTAMIQMGKLFADRYYLAAARPGDFDFDGDVDGADFLRWQRGESPISLSRQDLNDLQMNFGTTTQTLGTIRIIPEPSTSTMFCIGMVALLYVPNRFCTISLCRRSPTNQPNRRWAQRAHAS